MKTYTKEQVTEFYDLNDTDYIAKYGRRAWRTIYNATETGKYILAPTVSDKEATQ